MKNRTSGHSIAALIINIADHILNVMITLCIITALLYGGFGLWDTYHIYDNAGVDKELLRYKPSLNSDGNEANPTLLELCAINQDVCAWLTIDGTNIDYPVVQGSTNMDYINKNIYGEFSLSGSVFLDSRNSRDFSDFYSLIYAHHIEGNVMFGELPKFMEQDYFNEHENGMLFLPDCTYQIAFFACLCTDAYNEKVFNPTIIIDKSLQYDLLSYLKQEACQYREIGVTDSDRIIGLSTCQEAITNGRVMLFGRLRIYKEE